jgi:putative DNA primase/helicase
MAEVSRLKASVSISAVVASTLALVKKGHEFEACCPFHNEKTASFKVNDSKRFYHCFGCGAHGDVFDWLVSQRGMTLAEAVEHLGGDAGTAAPEGENREAFWHPIVPPPDDAPRPDLSGWDHIYTYCDADGVALFYVRRREAREGQRKQFIPLTYGTLNGKTGWHSRHPAAPRPLYGLDRLAARPDAPVLLCEGEKAADAAQRMFPELACVSWPAGTANVGKSDWSPLAGRVVRMWPDNDTAGAKAAAEVAALVPGLVILPVDDLPDKADAADIDPEDPAGWLADRVARATRRKINGHGEAPGPRRAFDGLDTEDPLQLPGQRQILVAAGRRHDAADAGLAAMQAAGVPFYQRSGQMVRACLTKAKGADGRLVDVPSVVSVTGPVLSRALGQSARWEKMNAKGELIRIDPPKEVVEQIGAMVGDWPFPPISGVIGTPTMRPDGSLVLTEGYDTATGLVLVAPPRMPKISPSPDRFDAINALELIDSLLIDFPFTTPASRSVALSMLLTPVLRGALGSAVPMHMVAAPQAGTGKSYLADIASVLATGEKCAVISVAAQVEETEKRLVGAALAGHPIIALDNCNGVLTGDFLAQVTERPLLQLRPLGTSGVLRVTNVFTVFANGNNISVSADLVRRTVLCGLDANMENPETRSFVNDPIADILADRGAYLAACLTIARAYICAGRPSPLPRIASFELWSDLVRSAIVWLGWEDPSAGTETIRAEDPSRNIRSAVFEAWATTLQVEVGYTTAELIEAAEKYDTIAGAFQNLELRVALLDVAKAKNSDRIDGKRLGWWLHSTAKVVSGNYKLLVDRANPSRPKWSIHRL